MAATSVVNLTVVASDVSTGASLTDGTDYSLQNPTDIDVVFGQYAVPPNPVSYTHLTLPTICSV